MGFWVILRVFLKCVEGDFLWDFCQTFFAKIPGRSRRQFPFKTAPARPRSIDYVPSSTQRLQPGNQEVFHTPEVGRRGERDPPLLPLPVLTTFQKKFFSPPALLPLFFHSISKDFPLPSFPSFQKPLLFSYPLDGSIACFRNAIPRSASHRLSKCNTSFPYGKFHQKLHLLIY